LALSKREKRRGARKKKKKEKRKAPIFIFYIVKGVLLYRKGEKRWRE